MLLKLITKTIASRIKPFLPELVSPNQCSFVPGQHVTDNIVICKELIHSVKSKQGQKGCMILKVDLEKTYDQLEWDIIKEILIDAGFPEHMIDVIFTCASAGSFKMLWNGQMIVSVKPARVWHGDPLTPYLFVLCLERLALRYRWKSKKEVWTLIRASHKGPQISISSLITISFFLLKHHPIRLTFWRHF